MTMESFHGWPDGGAIPLNAKPKLAEAIEAGMFVKQDPTDGEWVKADGTAGERAALALQSQSDYDVIEAQVLPAILQNVLAGTDQYAPADYAIDVNLEVDSANPGKLKLHAGGTAPVVAISKGIVVRDEISFLKIQIL